MFKIAIDGPAGAGKSTIAKALAKTLKIEYIDTGAMYRAITLKALRLGIDLEDENAYSFLADTDLDIENGKFFLDGEDVSNAIRSVEITENVSTPSKIGCVRSFLVDYQRKISSSKSVVMDGRDIGTVVLPNAELKIYLDATVECRANRRRLERLEQGIDKSLEETIEEIKVRDHKDSTRAISPLKKADDAVVIDSSDLSIDEVLEKIIYLVKERGLIEMSTQENKFTVGQTVTGIVTNVANSKGIYLEINEDVNAVIYLHDILELPKDGRLNEIYQEGSEFSAQVKQISVDKKDSKKVLLILSERLEEEKAAAKAKEEAEIKKLEKFQELKEADEVIEAVVDRPTKNGVELRYLGKRVFLSDKLALLSKEAFAKMRGEKIKVIIIYVNMQTGAIACSQVAADRKEKRLEKEAAFANIEVGSIVDATISSIHPYGLIVTLGPIFGLIHVSEVSYLPNVKLNEAFKVGDTIQAKVIKNDGQQVGLSIKQLKQHPWEDLKEKYHVGDVFDGLIKKIIPAGLIIELTPEYSGLMPKQEHSWLVSDKFDGAYQEGDTVCVKVMKIDDKAKRVSLSHRATLDNAWGNIKLHKGQIIDVTVASINEAGAVVNYENVSGFMSVAETTNQKRIASVAEVYPVGTTFAAMVMDFDPQRARLNVSAKAIQQAKERESFDKYMKEDNGVEVATLGDLFDKEDLK